MTLQVTIEKLIPGGKGLGYYGGRPVFVPLSVPGDQILVRSVRDRKSYLEALSSEVLQPSPSRHLPPCPYFGNCGGCDLQQIEDGEQLSAKREILVDALKRVGKIQYPVSRIRLTPSPLWNYRNRVQVKVNRVGDHLVWGFYRMGSHEIIHLDGCLITLPPLWNFLDCLMKWLDAKPSFVNGFAGIEILQGDDEEFLLELQLNSDRASLEHLATEFCESDLVGSHRVSFFLSTGLGKSLLIAGPGFVSKTVGDLSYQVGQGSFFQVNEFMLGPLRDCATAGAKGTVALDLYCGVGFFTLALARSFNQVLAVELGSAAFRDFRRNLLVNRLSNCCLFSQEAGAFIREHRGTLAGLDLVLLDPPRAGLGMKTVADVAGLGASLVVYVSCDPTMLSRDLAVFLKHRYEISSLDILDLFPQTHHFETVAKLKRLPA